MKSIYSWLVPASLALCAVMVIGSLGWITRSTLAAERERAQAEVRADLQERTRLALWRMDSLGAAFLLDESGYPDVESRLPVKLRFSISPKGELRATGADKQDAVLRKTTGTGGNLMNLMREITQTPAPPPEVKEVPQIESKFETKNSGYAYDRLDQQKQDAANVNEQALRSKAVQGQLRNASTNRFNSVGRVVLENAVEVK